MRAYERTGLHRADRHPARRDLAVRRIVADGSCAAPATASSAASVHKTHTGGAPALVCVEPVSAAGWKLAVAAGLKDLVGRFTLDDAEPNAEVGQS
jgi:hypothetical protein